MDSLDMHVHCPLPRACVAVQIHTCAARVGQLAAQLPAAHHAPTSYARYCANRSLRAYARERAHTPAHADARGAGAGQLAAQVPAAHHRGGQLPLARGGVLGQEGPAVGPAAALAHGGLARLARAGAHVHTETCTHTAAGKAGSVGASTRKRAARAAPARSLIRAKAVVSVPSRPRCRGNIHAGARPPVSLSTLAVHAPNAHGTYGGALRGPVSGFPVVQQSAAAQGDIKC
jgi:hypothetical protein